MNNKHQQTEEKSIEAVIRGQVTKHDLIQKSVDASAENCGAVTGVIGGGVTMMGLATMAGYCAWNFFSGTETPADGPFGMYFPMAVISAGLSLPLGLLVGYIASTPGHVIGKAYGIAKNAIIHGPIVTYRALRNLADKDNVRYTPKYNCE